MAERRTKPLPPPLETGDRLTRREFERRYEAMPLLKKAELIEGVVYMPSPIRHRHHGRPHGRLTGWLAFYEANPGIATDGGGNQLIIFRQGYRTPPHEAQAFINWGAHLQSLFPRSS